MIRSLRSLRCLPLLAAAQLGCSGAPVTTTSAPVSPAIAASNTITGGDVRRLLTALADDSLEGR